VIVFIGNPRELYVTGTGKLMRRRAALYEGSAFAKKSSRKQQQCPNESENSVHGDAARAAAR
jgi:hypothetical protein